MVRLKIIVILVMMGIPLMALPTLYGPTGLLEMPTAEVLDYQEYNMAVDYVSEARDVVAELDKAHHFYKLNIGTYDHFEMGVVGGSRPEEGVFLNMKYHIFSEEKRYPIKVAVGVEKLTSHHEATLYMVSSKSFASGFSGHFGFRALFDDTIDASLMMGGDYLITEKLTILADLMGVNDTYHVNIGSRYFFTENVSFQVALLNSVGNRNNPRFNCGLTLTKFL